MTFFNRFFILLLQLSFFVSFGQHSNVKQTQTPGWVNQITPDYKASGSTDAASGFYYLLVDNQDHLENEEFFRRRIYKILSATGVQEMADITLDFDPEYQQVNLHELKIIRDGKLMDKLDLMDIKVVQREANMERFLYDGSLTIIANLTDVRVGDIIDYSYTIEGRNPVHEGKFQTHFFLQSTLPLEQLKHRIIVPGEDLINYKLFHGAAEPEITKSNGATEFLWKAEKIEAFTYESKIPAWYDPAPAVEISQFNNWREVVDQYLKHFILPESRRNELGKKFRTLMGSQETDSTFINNSIRFVQDEVRYLGFENGLNSHKPSDPIDVLQRRYGDCKEKSFLLSEILQSAGIKAYPMLVHSFNGRNLKESLPSSGVFNHCVVQVELDNGEFKYIDPTINGQGGTLSNLYFPDYGYGLVLKPGESQLTQLPQPVTPQTRITQTIEFDEVGGGASLDIETIYKGNSADYRRKEFEESSRQSIQQEYSAFYSNLYPSITAAKNVSFRDYRDLNEFIVYEQYDIDSLWTAGLENPEVLFAEIYPMELESHLFPDKFSGRKMPYYIDRELNVKHKTIVLLPESWNISNEDLSYGTEEFSYNFKVNYRDKRIELEHTYQNLQDHVAPENLKAYLKEHTLAQQNISYSLSYDRNMIGITEDDSISWLAVIFMLMVIGGTGFFCFLIYDNYDLPSQATSRYDQKIGGWLVLIGVGLVITPVLTLIEILTSSGFLQSSSWNILSSSNDHYPLLGLFVGEFIFNAAYLTFSVLILILFFQRRTIAPRLIIWFFAVSFVFALLDTYLSYQLIPMEYLEGEKEDHIKDLAGYAVRCIIWIPYFLFSSRVKETFRVNRKTEPETEAIIPSPVIPG